MGGISTLLVAAFAALAILPAAALAVWCVAAVLRDRREEE